MNALIENVGVNRAPAWIRQPGQVGDSGRDTFENKKNRESQYMVSHPETSSDSPIGSDRDRGRDKFSGIRAWV